MLLNDGSGQLFATQVADCRSDRMEILHSFDSDKRMIMRSATDLRAAAPGRQSPLAFKNEHTCSNSVCVGTDCVSSEQQPFYTVHVANEMVQLIPPMVSVTQSMYIFQCKRVLSSPHSVLRCGQISRFPRPSSR
jgi:hypothetical protein